MHPVFPRRHNPRLRDYDYASEGLYFVTICTHLRRSLFGEIIDGTMHLNQAGKAVEETWERMFRASEESDSWIVMPNHLHGIIAITDPDDPGGVSRRTPLGRLIAAFKAASKKRINEIRQTPGSDVYGSGISTNTSSEAGERSNESPRTFVTTQCVGRRILKIRSMRSMRKKGPKPSMILRVVARPTPTDASGCGD
jgi:putative transposase